MKRSGVWRSNSSLAWPALRLPCAVGWLALAIAWVVTGPARAEEAATIQSRLFEAAKFLSSDELEGRGIGSRGLDRAADFVAEQFAAAGLDARAVNGGPFQRFPMKTAAKLGSHNSLAFVVNGSVAGKPQEIELKLGKTYMPQGAGGSAKFDLPLAFVGYGITLKDKGYDDYAGIDVTGKAVVVLRGVPQSGNPHSGFELPGADHMYFHRKISNAYEHGAAAVIFCTSAAMVRTAKDDHRDRWQAAVDQVAKEDAQFKSLTKPSAAQLEQHRRKIDELAADIQRSSKDWAAAGDRLLGFNDVGRDTSSHEFPVLFALREPIDLLVKAALAKSLDELEDAIDKDARPRSALLTPWHAVGQTSIERQQVEVKNVVGVLAGDGPQSSETIVLGAHYDHLGFGGTDSLSPGVRAIHNGADDNASGVSVMLEVARRLARRQGPLPRRVVFVAFTGEERGLVGSAYYVKHPLVPLTETIAMLNLDMVGRLKDDRLLVHGTGTAEGFDGLVDRLAKVNGFKVGKDPGGFGPSDHSSFYAKQVPVLFVFTGTHADYHRPSDDYDKLNVPGMQRVADFVTAVVTELARSKQQFTFRETGPPATFGRSGSRPYFGSVPDFSQEQSGYALTGVTKGGPAERAGIRAGDVIVKLGDSKIGNLEDFDSALRKHKAGQRLSVVVLRGGKPVAVEVTLDPPR